MPLNQRVGEPDAAAGDSDAALVAYARAGYAGAYEELVRRHEQRAYTLALRLCGDAEMAKDITQDAFIKAWRSLAGYD